MPHETSGFLWKKVAECGCLQKLALGGSKLKPDVA
jgi:hypothetical protein